MTKILFFFSLFLIQAARAEVSFDASQEILMTDKTCQALEERAQSIIAWTASITHDTPAMPECFCSSKSCRMDVAPISPYYVRQMTNFESGAYQNAAYDGPNCFNSALVAAQTLPNIVYTDPAEMSAIAGSPGRSCCSPKIRTETKNSVGTIVARRCSRNLPISVHFQALHPHHAVGNGAQAGELCRVRPEPVAVVEIDDRPVLLHGLSDLVVGRGSARRVERGA